MVTLPRLLRVVFLACAVLPAAAHTWYVDVAGTPPGTGTPADPYTSIQYAITQPTTLDGDVLLVLPGTYAETVDFAGKALALRSVAGAGTTTIDGGFAGSVVTIPDPPAGLVRLEGFRIVNGTGTLPPLGGPSVGGGILCQGGSALISGCLVEGNIADQGSGVALGGGTILDSVVRGNAAPDASFCAGLSLQIGGGILGGALVRGCVVQDNLTLHEGGGIHSAALVEGCTIQGNKAQFGGGVHGGTVRGSQLLQNDGSSCDFSGGGGGGAYGATLEGCTLAGNLAEDFGGGAAESTLVDCLVEGNAVRPSGFLLDSGGGGLFGCTAVGCTLRDNLVSPVSPSAPFPDASRGGGAADSVLERTLVLDNRAQLGGGVADCDVDRCTLFGNTGLGGGAYAGAPGATVLGSSIVWGNAAPALHGPVSASYSDVEGGWPGTGNLAADPRFCDAAGGDLHLKAGSPCIDAGDPLAPPDPDGSVADMGALPHDPAYCGGGCASGYCTAKVNSKGCLPVLVHSGVPSIALSTFSTTAEQLINNQPAALVWSTAPASAPFSGGTLCVAPPVRRTPIGGTGGNPPPDDCSGSADFPWTSAYMLSRGLSAGDVIHLQIWSRDPADPFQTSLTAGLEFTVCP